MFRQSFFCFQQTARKLLIPAGTLAVVVGMGGLGWAMRVGIFPAIPMWVSAAFVLACGCLWLAGELKESE